MAADGHLNFDTKIDESGFSGGVKKLGSIASSGLKILGGAVAGVTTAMGAALTAGMKYNSSMEDYFANFETMLGSTDAAMAHVTDLKEFASKTPFEMSDLANASKTLLAFGADVKDVTPRLKQLGDISLGNKEKFNSLALVYGQVSSAGKMMGQDLMQMINAGFNPLLEISKHTGESMDSLKDKMSKGQIGVEELNQALAWATEEGGQFAGGMEKASQTMSGLISTLKDNAMSLLGEVVKPISDGFTKTVLPAAISAMEELTNAFREDGVNGLIEVGSELLTNVLLGITRKAPAVVEVAVSILQNLINSFMDHFPAFYNAGMNIVFALLDGCKTLLPAIAGAGLEIIARLIGGIAEDLPRLLETGQSIVFGIIESIISAIPLLSEAAGMLVDTFGWYLQENGASFATAALELIGQLVTSLIEQIPWLAEVALNLVQSFSGFIIQSAPEILEAAVKLLETIGQSIIENLPLLAESALGIITKLAEGLVVNLPVLAGGVLKILQSFLEYVVANLPLIVKSAVEIINQLCAALVDLIPELVPAVFEIVMGIFQFIVDNLPLIIDSAVEIIQTLARGLVDNIGRLIPAIFQIFEGLFNGILNNLPTIIEGAFQIVGALASGLIEAIPEILRAIPTIIGAIWDGITGVDWLELGGNIISGIASGILNGVGGLISAAWKAAKSALNATCDFLGINSPSTVFRDQVGKYMAQGMGIGFEENIPTADMEKSLDGAVNSIQSSAATVHPAVPEVRGQLPGTHTAEDSQGRERPIIQIHTHVDLDGKEVGHSISEYVDEDMGENEDLKGRDVI